MLLKSKKKEIHDAYAQNCHEIIVQTTFILNIKIVAYSTID